MKDTYLDRDGRECVARIRSTVALMRQRLNTGQGQEHQAMCRLSLRDAESLLAAYDALRRKLVEEDGR